MAHRGLISRAISALLLSPLFLADPGNAEDQGEDTAARYIVFEVEEDGTVRPQMHRIVRLAARPRSLTKAEVAARLAEPSGDEERVAIRLFDSGGELAYEDVVEIPRWLRAEAAVSEDPSLPGEIEARRIPSPKRSFVVRVPVLPRSWLAVSIGREGGSPREAALRDAEFDLDALAADETLPLARFAPTLELRAETAGSPANRVDLLIMGDGYTSAESGKFNTDANNLLNTFFSIPPYNAYRNFVNTSTLFTASAQSGADHPPYDAACSPQMFQPCCADVTMQTDPKRGTFVNTAFDSTFCAFNTHRALVLDKNKVFAAAAATPNWDKIVVIANDSTYGGTGGPVAIISANPAAIGIAQHEYGHSFTLLADEYADPYPGYPTCSDISGPACEPNVTDQSSRSLIKWAPWILASTPVPTPADAGHASVVGLFQGARFMATGIYRPRLNCIMRQLGQPFCQICAQEYVLRLYRGGWGVPASGIDTIEPGSESPAPGYVPVPFPGSVTLSASLLQPTGGTLSTSWLVNDAVVPGATSNSYTFAPSAAGTHKVELRTKDTTSLVNPAMAGTSLQHSRVWTVAAGQSSRFQVHVDWRVPSQNRSGVGTEVVLTADTRYFWFFSSANVELVIKILDARGVNGHFWVFYGALSNVEYTIRITDTATGTVKTYFNPSGKLASVADTTAFPAAATGAAIGESVTVDPSAAMFASAASVAGGVARTAIADGTAAAAPCVADATALCLNGGRFQLRVNWSVPSQNRSGVGTAVPVTTDTGYFWFFSSANVELIVKVLDARGVNGKFWVFYGALSNVQYSITVTDTETGATKTYTNPSGQLASIADTSAF